MIEPYPAVEEWRNVPQEDFESLRELVPAVRTLRSEFNIAPGATIRFSLRVEQDFDHARYLRDEERLICSLCSAGPIQWANFDTDGTVAVLGRGFEAFVYVRSMIDVDAVLRRFEKSIEKESIVLERTRRKLGNENFLSQASPEIVDREHRKELEMSRKIGKLQGYVDNLKAPLKTRPG